MDRHIYLSLNTTGYNPELGDRIVEIFCAVTIDFVATGEVFHRYIRTDSSNIKLAKDGLMFSEVSSYKDFFSNKPFFHEIANELSKFLCHTSDTKIILFNCDFEALFLKSEFGRLEMALPLEFVNISKILFVKKSSNIFFDDLISDFKFNNKGNIKLAVDHLEKRVNNLKKEVELKIEICRDLVGRSNLNSFDFRKRSLSLSEKTSYNQILYEFACRKQDKESHHDAMRCLISLYSEKYIDAIRSIAFSYSSFDWAIREGSDENIAQHYYKVAADNGDLRALKAFAFNAEKSGDLNTANELYNNLAQGLIDKAKNGDVRASEELVQIYNSNKADIKFKELDSRSKSSIRLDYVIGLFLLAIFVFSIFFGFMGGWSVRSVE